MYTISKIAKTIQGKIEGNPNLPIKGICDLEDGCSEYISYVNSEKYEKFFNKTNASAILVNNEFSLDRGDKTLIRVNNPALSFIDIIHMFYPDKQNNDGIHPNAIIPEDVKLGNNINIAPYVVIEKGVEIGNSVEIGAGSFIGANTTIGDKTIIYANVSIYYDVAIGKNCIIDSGSVIGSDGFGLVTDNESHYKMPHIGSVFIKDNVWVGSNCCIDRGTIGNTIIDDGTKLDNFIQVAHNVKIGKNCRISGQTAIAGSTILEDNITIAGQVGIIDHLNIGKNSIIAAKSGVFDSLKPRSFVSGIPAKTHKDRLRQEVVINQLPKLLNRLRKLEKELSTIKEI